MRKSYRNAEEYWNILVTDDDKRFHLVIKKALKNLKYAHKPIHIYDAYTSNEAIKILQSAQDIAVLIMAGEMDSKQAKIKLIPYIRKTLKNNDIRIINYSETSVKLSKSSLMSEFTADEYRIKEELLEEHLYFIILSNIKSYENKIRQKSKLRYDLIFEMLPYGGEILDKDGYLIAVSPNTEKILGYEKNELLGQHVSCIFDTSTAQLFEEELPKILMGKSISSEIYLKRKDGKKISVIRATKPLVDSKGAISKILALNVDITKRIVAEKGLEKQNKIQSLLAKISSRFIALPSRKFDRQIRLSLKDLGELAKCDRAYMFLFNENCSLMKNTHEWVKKGMDSHIHLFEDVSVAQYPWLTEKLKYFKSVYYDVHKLPEEAVFEKEILTAAEIKSIFVVPIIYTNNLIGFLGFDWIMSYADLSSSDKLLLKNISKILAGVISAKFAEDKLNESEWKFKLLADHTNDWEYWRDQNGVYQYVSPACEKISGYPPEKFTEDSDFLVSIIYSEDQEHMQEHNKLNNDQASITHSFEFRIITKTGDIKWLEHHCIPIFKDGKYLGLRGNNRDITEKKKIVDNLKKMSVAIEQSPTSVMITDTKGIIEYVNPKFTESTGYSYNETIGRNPRMLKSGDHPYEYYTKLWATISKGGTWREIFHNKKKNGELFWEDTLIGPIISNDGKISNYIAIKEDITEKVLAEEKFRKLHRQNELLLASFSSILIVLDKNEQVIRWNDAAFRAFGLREKNVKYRTLKFIFKSEELAKIVEQVHRCKNEKKNIKLEELKYTNPDEKPGFLVLNISPFLTGDNEIEGFLIYGDDITDQKMIEEQLSQSQKLESIGQLAAGIAHEINTPAQFVGDNTQFLKDSFEDLSELFDKTKELVKEIENEKIDEIDAIIKKIDLDYLQEEIPNAIDQSLDGIHRVGKIVKAMKEFSHPGNKEKIMIDINRAISNTITVSKNEWKYEAELEKDFDPDLELVSCLPDEFNQVILNIIINAAHAIAEKRQGKNKLGKIKITTKSLDGKVQIKISDTGNGIPKEIETKIFDPFFTTKEVGKGTGQGLAIARDIIINKHGGTLYFESIPKKGTIFIIELPVN